MVLIPNHLVSTPANSDTNSSSSEERIQTLSPDSFDVIEVSSLESTGSEHQAARVAQNDGELTEAMRLPTEVQSSAPHQDAQPHGLISSAVEATVSLSTALFLQSIKPFTPYLSLAAQTALKTAQSHSNTFAAIGHSGQVASEHMQILSDFGTQLVDRAQEAQKHLNEVKDQKLKAKRNLESLRLSGPAFLRTLSLRTGAAAAGVGLFLMGEKLLAGHHRSDRLGLQSSQWGSALVLTGALSALLTTEGTKFRHAISDWVQSCWSGSGSGVDAATELAESLTQTQILLGTLLKYLSCPDNPNVQQQQQDHSKK